MRVFVGQHKLGRVFISPLDVGGVERIQSTVLRDFGVSPDVLVCW